ncbi:MAG: alpha/beta fold hydrolase [Deltaproteobacteria bacterium]|nr:MAG: alpha/beta fold hydrolase [Deltaproteobacteria bacterium]
MTVLVGLLSFHALVCLMWTLVSAAMWALVTGTRPRLRREAIGWMAREWGAAMVVFALRPTGWWQPRSRPSRGTEHRDPATPPPVETTLPPVLLVPGFGLNRRCFLFLALYLRRRGWRWVWAINNRPFSGPIQALAVELGHRVEELCEASGSDRVDIVAHSMGGLVAAWYIQHLGGARRVRRLVALGTPWAGSRMAIFGPLRQARDLEPGSETLSLLGPSRVPTTTVWSPHDNIVLPPESARAPWTTTVAASWTGHLTLLLSATALRHVAGALLSPGRTPPADDDTGAACPAPSS